jgi:two-component system chemotaxis response regulator CheY
MSTTSQLLTQTPAQSLVTKQWEDLIRSLKILIVDDDQAMRKVVRTMLTAIGVREIHDACDGMAGLQAICGLAPDIVIVDWEMPQVGGAEFIRSVRDPGSFPLPNVPIIVLSGHGERSCVVEAMQLGANEYLLKPVSTKSLFDRLVSIFAKPRPMVKIGDYYGPTPRNLSAYDLDQFGVVVPSNEQARAERKNQVGPRPADRDKTDTGDDVVMI